MTKVTIDAGKYEKKYPKLSSDFILWQSLTKAHLHATQFEKEIVFKKIEYLSELKFHFYISLQPDLQKQVSI